MKLPEPVAPAAFYATLIPYLREIALKNGYALAIHGSMQRDIDLVAIPWVKGAEEPEVLIASLKKAIGGHDVNRLHWVKNPEKKPHGRIAWSFYFNEQDAKRGTGPYLDISVMPLSEEMA